MQEVCRQLADLCGGSPATWENRMYGLDSHYNRVAQMNTALRAGGHPDRAAEFMTPIEASMGCAPRADAEVREGLMDAHEDAAQAAYRANPCADTARTLLQRRAAERQASLDHDREIAARFNLTL
ncbi:MAG TPA: hypothetical protein VEB59_12365 [Gemmatimonadales bacterium]|nr:hypothetical protein [Gemmatimonadales bacterium]